jgi:hypothetical protein
MELCLNMIANNLHTIPSIEYLPSHLMKDILDRKKNECMTDADRPGPRNLVWFLPRR